LAIIHTLWLPSFRQPVPENLILPWFSKERRKGGIADLHACGKSVKN